jgi:hypothetical protein
MQSGSIPPVGGVYVKTTEGDSEYSQVDEWMYDVHTRRGPGPQKSGGEEVSTVGKREPGLQGHLQPSLSPPNIRATLLVFKRFDKIFGD